MENMSYIKNYIQSSIEVKQKVLSDAALLSTVEMVVDKCTQALKSGNKIILAGNGGSAADAQHIAAEFVSRFFYDRPGLPAMALTTDTSIITAIGNDYGYDKLFSRQIQALGNPGDVFIGITTSGNSVNIINAIEEANSKGLLTIGLCGNKGKILDLANVCMAIPNSITPYIQECHIMLGHIICAMIERNIFPQE
ncbi:D-sedoheptulose 7-phosphate isomerase [Rosenbergiella epipactidis]|uniref:D-sedoheptulose 7-phosphate isomerase n=1 Tax=Rosenbergiella epipactidis TaxID=1544694 RepID=UPI001F4D606D|nr:D-sedoheptulose 7-phosphate isomerase [Rosenbergiella epipactidis]MCL9668598.1 D-sedoheptulose 7-phosphate isomerase [Rosenbergiella epipactidis]